MNPERVVTVDFGDQGKRSIGFPFAALKKLGKEVGYKTLAFGATADTLSVMISIGLTWEGVDRLSEADTDKVIQGFLDRGGSLSELGEQVNEAFYLAGVADRPDVDPPLTVIDRYALAGGSVKALVEEGQRLLDAELYPEPEPASEEGNVAESS